MSAEELIDTIKSLDAEERAKIFSFFLNNNGATEPALMSDEKFDRLADHVIERHADLLQKLAQ